MVRRELSSVSSGTGDVSASRHKPTPRLANTGASPGGCGFPVVKRRFVGGLGSATMYRRLRRLKQVERLPNWEVAGSIPAAAIQLPFCCPPAVLELGRGRVFLSDAEHNAKPTPKT